MENKVIDVSGLTPKQMAIIEEIVASFKVVAQQSDSSPNIVNQQNTEVEPLDILHQEFDWLIADLGVKEPIKRSDIYGLPQSD
jgi:ornithine carbamoyltransferase